MYIKNIILYLHIKFKQIIKMRTILKFQTSEKFFLADLTEVEPTEKDLVIEVTEENSEINTEEFTLSVETDNEPIELDIYPRKCEFSSVGINNGYLVGGVVISENSVNEYCKTLGFESWDKFINTESVYNPETEQTHEIYISDEKRKEMLESDEDIFIIDGVEVNKNNFENLGDATTDDSYYTEWEIDEDEPIYLSNGLNININAEEE